MSSRSPRLGHSLANAAEALNMKSVATQVPTTRKWRRVFIVVSPPRDFVCNRNVNATTSRHNCNTAAPGNSCAPRPPLHRTLGRCTDPKTRPWRWSGSGTRGSFGTRRSPPANRAAPVLRDQAGVAPEMRTCPAEGRRRQDDDACTRSGCRAASAAADPCLCRSGAGARPLDQDASLSLAKARAAAIRSAAWGSRSGGRSSAIHSRIGRLP